MDVTTMAMAFMTGAGALISTKVWYEIGIIKGELHGIKALLSLKQNKRG